MTCLRTKEKANWVMSRNTTNKPKEETYWVMPLNTITKEGTNQLRARRMQETKL